jgi:2'-5' RNA ligase
MSDVIRAFVAVPIGEAVREGLERAQKQLREANAHVSWVRPENIHLTLAFLGDIFESQMPGLAKLLECVAQEFPAFEVHAEKVGFFGSERSPRVVWVGLEPPEGPLNMLQASLAEGIRSLGFALEDRPFHAHLTLGRVRSRRGVDGLTSLMRSAKNTSFGLIKVDRILLMQSRVAHQGVQYSILHESILKGVGSHGG